MIVDDANVDRANVLTAAGASALAVVRLEGPGVSAFLAAWFSRPLVAARPTHGHLRDEQGVIDDPVVLLNADGSAELSLHGSAWIVRSVIDLATRHGFIVGETPSASIEEDVQRALPLVKTELAARMLLAQARAWSLAFDPAETLADRALDHLLNPPTIAIVGLPNAGKSTLANALFGTQRSIVSDVAGTTRDWVGEAANLHGLVVTLLDTPGLRETDDWIEARAIDLSRTPIARANLVVLLLDAMRDDPAQQALLELHPNALVVLNKIDARLPAWTDERIAALAGVPVCARTGDGVDRLIRRVQDAFGIHRRPLEAARPFLPAHVARLRMMANESPGSGR